MDGKRRSGRGARLSPIERALRALTGEFPMVRRDRDVLFVGSDGLLASKRGVKHLRLRFWAGAKKEYRDALVKVLDKARIPYEVGPEYEIEHKGKKLDPTTPVLELLGASGEEVIGRIERTPHVRACLLCKEILDQAATGDLEYQQRAYGYVRAHIKENPPKPDGVPCQYSGCVLHEPLPRDLAKAMINLSKGGAPWKDQRGVLVSTLSLLAGKDDHPRGWNFKPQDAESRHFKDLFVDEAAIVYVRLAPKQVMAHVWIEPQYPTKREAIDDPATLEDVVEVNVKLVPALKEWALRKYAELKGLAEMDIDFGKPEKKEDR